ncbi:hypothetical protein PARPLA_03282 [Rhodobacteraceae bacterium THAF1]|nr:hypothetical protein FIU81_07450 [Palleronia sp. THAF1]VDC31382.1 hypothetical protein PARPLA_03282 [Rhodobacteraceae bacterium THAF1]
MNVVQFFSRSDTDGGVQCEGALSSYCGSSELIQRARQGRLRALDSERAVYMNVFADELRVVSERA